MCAAEGSDQDPPAEVNLMPGARDLVSEVWGSVLGLKRVISGLQVLA